MTITCITEYARFILVPLVFVLGDPGPKFKTSQQKRYFLTFLLHIFIYRLWHFHLWWLKKSFHWRFINKKNCLCVRGRQRYQYVCEKTALCDCASLKIINSWNIFIVLQKLEYIIVVVICLLVLGRIYQRCVLHEPTQLNSIYVEIFWTIIQLQEKKPYKCWFYTPH